MRDRKRDLGMTSCSRWPHGVLVPHEHDDEDSNLESEQSSRQLYYCNLTEGQRLPGRNSLAGQRTRTDEWQHKLRLGTTKAKVPEIEEDAVL